MAEEILRVTGHEEQNAKKRYSSKQAPNGSEFVVNSTPRPFYSRERATVFTVQAAELEKAAH